MSKALILSALAQPIFLATNLNFIGLNDVCCNHKGEPSLLPNLVFHQISYILLCLSSVNFITLVVIHFNFNCGDFPSTDEFTQQELEL